MPAAVLQSRKKKPKLKQGRTLAKEELALNGDVDAVDSAVKELDRWL